MWHFQVLLGSGALVLLALLLDLARALGWRRPPLYRMPTHWLDPAERALLAVLSAPIAVQAQKAHGQTSFPVQEAAGMDLPPPPPGRAAWIPPANAPAGTAAPLPGRVTWMPSHWLRTRPLRARLCWTRAPT